ncbi:MAG TPA: hypothetical protein VIV63_17300, partial [Steroidobacteraceae bacterium]
MKIKFLNHYLNLPIAILALIETLLIIAAPMVVELLLRGRSSEDIAWSVFLPRVVTFAFAVGVSLTAMGLYNSRQRARTIGLVLRAFVAHLLALGLVVIVSYFAPLLRPSPGQLFAWGALSFFFISVIRVVAGVLLDEEAFKRRVLVYGAGQRARSLRQLRRRADQRGFHAVGYMPAPGEETLVEQDVVLAQGVGRLRELAKELNVDEIVIAMDDRRREFPLRELLDCRLNGIEVIDLVSFLERETGRVHLDVLNPSWIIFADGFRRDAMRQATKRLFDMVASLALVLVTWPFMLFTMLAIVFEDGLRA